MNDIAEQKTVESKRRTVVKSLVWRLIGIVWTWIGAYIILLIIPEKYNSAAIIATLIVIYHHSTRLLMYYLYERLWSRIKWGRSDHVKSLSFKEKIVWSVITILTISIIFFLIIYVTPLIKGNT